MLKKPKVLILTAKYGNGHVQVSKTLVKQCRELGIEEVVVSDLYAESNPVFTEITQYLYLKSFTIGKQFYRMFYYGVDKIYNKKLLTLYFKLGNKRLHELIEKEQPDIIINTFPIIVVPEYRRRTGNIIPTFNVLTDFCLHKIWVHKNIDKYYVASKRVKEKVMSLGIHPASVKVTGIPIRSQFEENLNEEAIYKKYNLDPSKKTLLVMAGAHGVLKNVKELCESFLEEQNLQTVVVCGNNTALKESLESITGKNKENLKLLGYVERVDELFRIASCMVTKPGGITLSEAAAVGVPVILYKPVPGQEKENALFFQENEAALVVNRSEEVYEAVSNLLQNDKKLRRMKRNIKRLHHPNSSLTIMEDIVKEAAVFKEKKYIKAQ
ncbi:MULTISPECIES: diglucosyl diacylglycerol synthase [Metabacillus]|uniref:Diglucosyl diacylglycerol synthase n=1 Tax=Metabacillus hrfriensis TaxID=3048891 RepID=A0ACD4R6Y7_9BACI|nr:MULTISPECIES: diglucosyl diacylglycerol synthase [Metabacillus]UAL50721.1 diglucosyl diacylglycerol synthase [Metabacillus dongyingensis]UOK56772.1 diglucosyl diacylglycerol synthase [Bacillus sp. OVS6]USK26991.1 diglucosyl diacylglycerol synthase [Bacillus sp. CMF21]WHZ56214.1 diglucosyl diacylglycerol synthase [Metabacillus sp. CT-WN-B3]